MFATNPERFNLWRDVVEARNSRAYDVITATFHSRWVFADAGYEKFIDRATQDPSFRTGIATPDCSVYSLATPVDGGSVRIDSWTASDGRTTGVTPNEFVDVERIAGPAATHDAASDPCARLTGALTSTGAASARLIVSTDDVVRFSVNGTQVFDSATAAPPTIDEVLERKREGIGMHERRFSVSLNPGYNAVAVESCRRGLNWGFNLRADAGP